MTRDYEQPNTFGEYSFPEWVPQLTGDMIRSFWGIFGRTYEDWLDSPNHQGVREFCHHGPGPNGFGMPPNYATVEFMLKDRRKSAEVGSDVYKLVRGRYVHRWNNMGSLIDEHGEDHTVSTCDRWVRVFENVDEKVKALG
ncbi:hypothetical protein GTC6_05442 [Gordonia terrae C-6]|uniref:Uncharacterized protein n=1 Tax=Gordonia terrae C-6 TaxID=1316928 RepID=R7YCM1_9ACTN|nr:hypothetical protein [Gordonia terrae]EON33785.1 hypothetical protein GTC6_05442 [Gordonia terrae C-6]